MKLSAVLAALVVSTASVTLAAQAPAASDFHDAADLEARSSNLIARASHNSKGSGNSTLGSYPNHDVQFNVKTKSGISEMHAHFCDNIVVTNGEATIVTGGTIPGATTESPGETRGTTIEGGQAQHVSKGDVLHIGPNTPHQILVEEGKTVSFLNIKVAQP